MSDQFVDQNFNTPSSPAVEPAIPTPSAPTPATPAPHAAAPATPTAPQAPATGVPEGYVPSYRLRETREAALREARELLSAAEQRYQAQLAEQQQKIAALAGFAPPSQSDPQIDAVKQQFSKLYPGLAKIEQRAADIERYIEQAQNLEAQTSHYWQNYGRQQVDRLTSLAQESIGAPLNEEGKRVLVNSFIGFVQSSPEMTARYEEDPTLVEDFWKSYQSNFIDPVRRSNAANVAQRVPQGLPQDSPSGAPRATPAPQLNGLDDRANAAWTYFNNLRNQT